VQAVAWLWGIGLGGLGRLGGRGDAGGEVGVELAGAGGFARGGEAGYDYELGGWTGLLVLGFR
jgi:hypothetical protein